MGYKNIANFIGFFKNYFGKMSNIFLSILSIWEMQIKTQLGRLNLLDDLQKLVNNQKRINNLQILPITEEHIYHLSNLPHHHNDPFDRLLIAQSLAENLMLVSDDASFLQYNVKLL